MIRDFDQQPVRPGDRIEDWEGDRATIVGVDPVRLVWDGHPRDRVVTPTASFLSGGFRKLDDGPSAEVVRWFAREVIANELHGFGPFPVELKEPAAREMVANSQLGWPSYDEALAYLEEEYTWTAGT